MKPGEAAKVLGEGASYRRGELEQGQASTFIDSMEAGAEALELLEWLGNQPSFEFKRLPNGCVSLRIGDVLVMDESLIEAAKIHKKASEL